jgi:hypothetical protein
MKTRIIAVLLGIFVLTGTAFADSSDPFPYVVHESLAYILNWKTVYGMAQFDHLRFAVEAQREYNENTDNQNGILSILGGGYTLKHLDFPSGSVIATIPPGQDEAFDLVIQNENLPRVIQYLDFFPQHANTNVVFGGGAESLNGKTISWSHPSCYGGGEQAYEIPTFLTTEVHPKNERKKGVKPLLWVDLGGFFLVAIRAYDCLAVF